MQHLSDLIKAFDASASDPGAIKSWWEHTNPADRDLVAVAEHIGAEYLSGRLSYLQASDAMNQLMPLAGFEAAPLRFWEYYIAFEDAETLEDPDPQARIAVQAVARQGAA